MAVPPKKKAAPPKPGKRPKQGTGESGIRVSGWRFDARAPVDDVLIQAECQRVELDSATKVTALQGREHTITRLAADEADKVISFIDPMDDVEHTVSMAGVIQAIGEMGFYFISEEFDQISEETATDREDQPFQLMVFYG